MGCGQSSEAVDPVAAKRNQQIEEELKRDRIAMRTEVKMLLLGAGESGKSTMVKQMRLLYAAPYSTEERESYREVVFSNTLQSMQAVLRGFGLLELQLPSELEGASSYILALEATQFEDSARLSLDPQIAKAIGFLWAHPRTKEVVEMANKFQLNDSASYFFDELPRIANSGFIPSDQDILRTRVRSTGITEEKFKVKGYLLRVFDVGGQRSERKKWIHCFENVQVLVFVAAVNEYDQCLWEDESINRMDEATMLFESISSSRWFERSAFVLLLNKTDLLKEKLLKSPLEKYFPEYTGGSSFENAKAFIRHKFEVLDPKRDKRAIYTYMSCATDTAQVQVILAAVMDTVLTSLLAEVGLM